MPWVAVADQNGRRVAVDPRLMRRAARSVVNRWRVSAWCADRTRFTTRTERVGWIAWFRLVVGGTVSRHREGCRLDPVMGTWEMWSDCPLLHEIDQPWLAPVPLDPIQRVD